MESPEQEKPMETAAENEPSKSPEVKAKSEPVDDQEPAWKPTGDPWDTEQWQMQLQQKLANENSSPDSLIEFLRIVLVQFPTSAQHWIQLIQLELKAARFQQAQEHFARSLPRLPHLDLWKLYLTFVKRINGWNCPIDQPPATVLPAPPTTLTPEQRLTITQAFEYTLLNVGLDPLSTPVWQDYLRFIQSWQVNNPLEEGHRMDALRKTYHRAICIPLDGIEHIWKDYDTFENQLNRMTAKKFLSEKSPLYMTARAAVRELKRLREPLGRFVMARPPHSPWTEHEHKQVDAWKRLVRWERTNPLHYDDKPSVVARVLFTYKQALMNQRHYPEIWCECVEYLLKEAPTPEQKQQGLVMLQEALECLPDSILVHFYAAELAENEKRNEDAKKIFEDYLARITTSIDRLQAVHEELSLHIGKHVLATGKRKRGGAGSITGESINGFTGADSADEADTAAIGADKTEVETKQKELEQVKIQLDDAVQRANLCWIQFMKFTRRTEGMKHARLIFSRARKTTYCGAEVFMVSALMEYYCNKDKTVAFKIFEVGLKQFGNNVSYVLCYMNHLIAANDDSNMRALFERTVSGNIDTKKSQPLWDRFLQFENDFGDLASIQGFQKRWMTTFEQPDRLIQMLAERFSYGDLQIVLRQELGIDADDDKLSATVTSAALRHEDSRAEMSSLADDAHDEPEIVVLPTTREEELMFPPKKRSLTSVQAHKFARPDIKMFSVYKPDPEQLKERERIRAEKAEQQLQQQQQRVSSPSVMGQPPSAGPAATSKLYPPIIQQFLNQLPPASSFRGPRIPVDTLMNLVMTSQFLPPGPPPMMPGMMYPPPHAHPGPPPPAVPSHAYYPPVGNDHDSSKRLRRR